MLVIVMVIVRLWMSISGNDMNCQRDNVENDLQNQMPCDVHSIQFHQCLSHSTFKHIVEATYQLRRHKHGDKENCYV